MELFFQDKRVKHYPDQRTRPAFTAGPAQIGTLREAIMRWTISGLFVYISPWRKSSTMFEFRDSKLLRYINKDQNTPER